MSELLQRVSRLSEPELQQLLSAVAKRFSQLCPDREVLFMTLSKDPRQRQLERQQILDFMEAHPDLWQP